YGHPPALPTDSNVDGVIVFDSNTEDRIYRLPKGVDSEEKRLARTLLNLVEPREADPRASHLIRFSGLLFDEAKGFDTERLVTSDEDLTKAEQRHLDIGSMFKARIAGIAFANIATLSGYSRPMTDISMKYCREAAMILQHEHVESLLERALSDDRPLRVVLR